MSIKIIARLAFLYREAHRANENNPAMLISGRYDKNVGDGCVKRMNDYFLAEKALFKAVDNVKLREITLYRGLVLALARIYRYISERGTDYYFTRKEVKGMFRNENDTARFGDLALFGGLVTKTKKAHYELDMERCRDFLRGDLAIPVKVWKNPITGEITTAAEDCKTISQLPNLTDLLDSEGFYKVNYKTK